jgi:gliding motility-associated-like protein
MKLFFQCGMFLLLLFFSASSFSQVFWTETFGTGCNSGTIADGFVSANGTWNVSATGPNGALANVWYVSAEENGQGVGNCGTACGSNPTLHIGSGFADLGAAYLTDNSFGDPTTNVRAESPSIDCSGQSDICLSFEYIENGDGLLDNHTLWYFDGASWTQLDNTPKTPITCAPQGLWSIYNITLPASANNNPAVRIGFQWENNADGIGTDPSVAIYNIRLTGNDTTAPDINCIDELNIYTDANCESFVPDLVLPPFTYVSDNCTSVGNLAVSQDVAPGTSLFGHLTVMDVVITVTDEAGNSNTCTTLIRTIDTISPVLNCPVSDVPAAANSNCEAILGDYTALIAPQDNCTAFGDLSITQNPPAGITITDDQVVQFVVQDNAGNISTCIFTVEFRDTIVPSVLCPVNPVQSTSAASCDTLILDYTTQMIWSDNCTTSATDILLSQSPPPFSVLSAGNHTIVLSAEDEAGNVGTCSFNLEVLENIPPQFDTCLSDSTLPLVANCEVLLPDYTAVAQVSDNCTPTGDIIVSQNPAPGSVVSGIGTVVNIVLTAVDNVGNSATCEFSIELGDTTPPTLICPNDSIIPANQDCEYSLGDFVPLTSVSDNCTSSGDLLINQNPTIGTIYSIGVYPIEMSAIDNEGNTGSCSFELSIIDTLAPDIIFCPSEQEIFLDENCTAQLPDFVGDVNVTDNCTSIADMLITQSPAVGSVISSSGTVSVLIEDLFGNIATCLIDYELLDTIAPILICPIDSLVDITGDCEYTAPDFTSSVDVSDNCTSVGDLIYSQSPSSGTPLSGPSIIEVVVVDASGNAATCQVNLIPDDNIAPTITCPSDDTIDAGSDCSIELDDYMSLAVVDDNCSGFLITQSPAPLSTLNIGAHQVELLVTDAGGNSASCQFDVLVIESIAPTIICPAPLQTCDQLVIYDMPVANDNCSVFEVIQQDGTGLTSGDIFPIGTTNQSFEVIDDSGNTASCSFTIEVLDFPDEAIILTTTQQLCDTTSIVLVAQEPNSGTGEWSIIAGSATLNNQFATTTGANNLSFGVNQFVWTVTSSSCGSSSDTLTVTVYQQPFPAATQDSMLVCNDTLASINGNTPNVGQGLWYASDVEIDFFDETQPNTFVFNLSGGWNEVIWQISNGNCPISEDTLRIFVYESAVIYTVDTSLCVENNELMLEGNEIYPGITAYWYMIEGNATIESMFSPTTEVYNISGGTNVFVYATSHPVCGTTTDNVLVNIQLCGEYDPLIPTVFTPNNDGKNDLFVVENLHALYPECQVKIVNRWGSLVFESDGYENPWDGTNMGNGELLPPGTYFYRIYLNDGEGTELTGPISIIR